MNQKKVQAQNGGRLRTHDRDDIAEKLINWAKKDDSLNLCAFCSQIEIDPSKLSNWAKECDRFRQSLNRAKCSLAARREEKVSTGDLHLKAYDLNITTYDYFLKEERRDQLIFESDLKKQLIEVVAKLKHGDVKGVTPELSQQFDALMNQLTICRDSPKIQNMQAL